MTTAQIEARLLVLEAEYERCDVGEPETQTQLNLIMSEIVRLSQLLYPGTALGGQVYEDDF